MSRATWYRERLTHLRAIANDLPDDDTLDTQRGNLIACIDAMLGGAPSCGGSDVKLFDKDGAPPTVTGDEHVATGDDALVGVGAQSTTITLTGDAVFSDATAYEVLLTFIDPTQSVSAVMVVKNSGSSFTVSGTTTGSIAFIWAAIGKKQNPGS